MSKNINDNFKDYYNEGKFDATLLNELYAIKDKFDIIRNTSKKNIEALKDYESWFNTHYVYNTNNIEGNTLTLSETTVILEYGTTVAGKSMREHCEAVNSKMSLAFLHKNLNAEITEDFIFRLHEIITAGTIEPEFWGIYRNIPVHIRNSNHIPPMPEVIPNAIKDLLKSYEEDIKKYNDKVLSAIRFHLAFESIHPFKDGNGRVGRLLLNIMLIKSGFLPIIIESGERVKYFEAIENCRKNFDIDELIMFIASIEIDEIKNYCKFVYRQNVE